MRRRHPLPLKHRRWITLVGMLAAGVGAFAGVMGRDYLGALFSVLLGLFLWLTWLGFENANRPAPWLLYLVMAALVALSLYRILFTFASPT